MDKLNKTIDTISELTSEMWVMSDVEFDAKLLKAENLHEEAKREIKERKNLKVSDNVKINLENLKDLYGFKTHNDILAFLIICHLEKLKETLTAVEFIEYKKYVEDWK